MKTDLYVEVLDTTLRDGEQTPGVSFTPKEKLDIARMLRRLKVDRIEIGSARVSDGEGDGVKKILAWSNDHDNPEKLEILGFVDGGRSVDWIRNKGGKVINLLCKGSRNHCEIQLKKTPERHLADIRKEIEKALSAGLKVNLYLEDWSSGVTDSFEYVLSMVSFLKDLPVERFMLCDTLGKMDVAGLEKALTLMNSAFPQLHYDFHGHNDYNMACANALTALNAASAAYTARSTVSGNVPEIWIWPSSLWRSGIFLTVRCISLKRNCITPPVCLKLFPASGVPGTLLSSEAMCLPRLAVCTPTATAKGIFIAINFCLNALSGSVITLWGNFLEKPQSTGLLNLWAGSCFHRSCGKRF